MLEHDTGPAIPRVVIAGIQRCVRLGIVGALARRFRAVVGTLLRLVVAARLLRFSPATEALCLVLVKRGVLETIGALPVESVAGLLDVLAKPGVAFSVSRISPSVVVDLIKTLTLPGALPNFRDLPAAEINGLARHLA